MQQNNPRQYVEAIKLAVASVAYRNLSIQETLQSTIGFLYDYYCEAKRKDYLIVALYHMQAYLELGFRYALNEKLFDKVLKCLDLSKVWLFDQLPPIETIKANKSQIRGALGRWPYSRKGLKLDDAVNDILGKVQARECGVYQYKCERTEVTYELVIGESEMILRDLSREVYYSFVDTP